MYFIRTHHWCIVALWAWGIDAKMAHSNERLDEHSSNSSEDAADMDLEKVCFMCLNFGDPITDKLKKVTGNILSKCKCCYWNEKQTQPGGTRKSLDIPKIKLPENLQETRIYHQSCFRNLKNVSGKKQLDETSHSTEDASNLHAEEMP